MGQATQVHRVATVLVGAAHVAHHDWPKVETDLTLQRIVANAEGLLHALRVGDPPKADEHLRALDDLLVSLPQEDVTDGFRS